MNLTTSFSSAHNNHHNNRITSPTNSSATANSSSSYIPRRYFRTQELNDSHMNKDEHGNNYMNDKFSKSQQQMINENVNRNLSCLCCRFSHTIEFLLLLLVANFTFSIMCATARNDGWFIGEVEVDKNSNSNSFLDFTKIISVGWQAFTVTTEHALVVDVNTYDLKEISPVGDVLGVLSLMGLFISLFLSGTFFTFFVSVRSKYAMNINPNAFTYKRMKNISRLSLAISLYIILVACLMFYITIIPDMNKNYKTLDKTTIRNEEVFLEGAWAYELLWTLAIMWFIISAVIFVQSKRITDEMVNVRSRNDEMVQRLEHGEVGLDLEFIDASESS